MKLSKRSLHNRKGIDPRLIEIDDVAIGLTLVDYGHPSDAGLRLATRQYEMFLDPNIRTKCDGYLNVSNHQAAPDGYGKALDFFAFVDGKASWEYPHLAMVACAYFQAASMLNYRITWGGLWKEDNPDFVNAIPYGWDSPHIELLDF